jgi:high affinity sulfate transporter 1
MTSAALAVRLRKFFPIVEQLERYRAGWLTNDVSAGLAVAAVALPTAVAYPAIAGLPPEMGLYASIMALIGYALFGSSRQLIVGPDAATLTILAASLFQLFPANAGQRVMTASLFAVGVGLLCLSSGALRLGFIANFLSRPILTGYLCGVSLSLIAGQIYRLTAVPVESPGFLRPLVELAGEADRIHLPTLAVGIGAFLALRAMKVSTPRAPAPLIVLAAATFLSFIFGWEALGVQQLGQIGGTVPTFSLLIPADIELDAFVLQLLGVLVVSFGSGIVTARSFGAKNRYRVDANRELIGFGAANIASGLFGGFPVTGADSRTAVNDAAGGRTQLAGLIAAAALIAALLLLADLLQFLPVAVLGAILASVAIDLIDHRELRELWQTSRAEFLFAMTAMIGVIVLGVLKGVLIAIAATGIYLLARVSRPRDALLGCIAGRDGLYKLHREPRARPVPGLAIYLVQSVLVFFNVDYVRGRIRWIIDRLPQSTRWFVLDAEAITLIDSTAAAVLKELCEDLARRNVRFGIANLHAQPRELLTDAGLLTMIGPDMLFNRSEDAVRAFENAPTP